MPVAIHKLCCQGCGATLPVEDGVRFLTCNYCHARLEIVHRAETTHTKLLDDIDERTKRIEKKLDAIQVRTKLEDLDASWKAYQASISTKDREGNLHLPSMGAALVYAGVTLVIAFVIAVLLVREAILISSLSVGLGIWIAARLWSTEEAKVRAYEGLQLRYQLQRKELLRLIAESGSPCVA
jgi:hypothetical protein